MESAVLSVCTGALTKNSLCPRLSDSLFLTPYDHPLSSLRFIFSRDVKDPPIA